jgi:hypothetical protein
MSVISATWEVLIRRIMVQASPGKKLVRPHLNHKKKLGVVAFICPVSYTRGTKGESPFRLAPI